MTGKKRAPVFSYIITWLNPIIPPVIVFCFGGCFVLYTKESEKTALTWNDFHFQAFLVGWYLCIATSLWYYIMIRNGRFRPRWWSNLLLILSGYAIIPLFSLIIPQKITSDPPPIASEFLIISVFAFLITTFLTGRFKPKWNKPEKKRFRSPWCIPLFVPAYYALFFATAIASSMFIQSGFYSLGWLALKINTLLRAPFLTELTFEFVKQHFPGPKAHIVILLNALVWSFAAWRTLNWMQKTKSAEACVAKPGSEHQL